MNDLTTVVAQRENRFANGCGIALTTTFCATAMSLSPLSSLSQLSSPLSLINLAHCTSVFVCCPRFRPSHYCCSRPMRWDLNYHHHSYQPQPMPAYHNHRHHHYVPRPHHRRHIFFQCHRYVPSTSSAAMSMQSFVCLSFLAILPQTPNSTCGMMQNPNGRRMRCNL